MEKITLHIKDKSQLNLLLERLKQFDFVEISLPQGPRRDLVEKKRMYKFSGASLNFPCHIEIMAKAQYL